MTQIKKETYNHLNKRSKHEPITFIQINQLLEKYTFFALTAKKQQFNDNITKIIYHFESIKWRNTKINVTTVKLKNKKIVIEVIINQNTKIDSITQLEKYLNSLYKIHQQNKMKSKYEPI